MHTRSPALSEQIAGLRNTAQAGQETRVWLPAAIDAFIAAIFARIFGRLEQLLLLWQTGELPAPQSPLMTAAPRASAPKKSVRHPRQRPHRQRPAPATRPVAPRQRIKFFCFFLFTKRRLPYPSPARPRQPSARAPPAPLRPISHQTSPKRGCEPMSIFITI